MGMTAQTFRTSSPMHRLSPDLLREVVPPRDAVS